MFTKSNKPGVKGLTGKVMPVKSRDVKVKSKVCPTCGK